MRPQATNTAALLAESPSSPPLPYAPWAAGISPAVERELELATVAEHPAHTVDVAVIGAGVAGLSAALGARAAGATVAVFEAATTIGAGATGRNAGILSAGVNMALADVPAENEDLRAIWPATNQLLLSLVEESRQPGALVAASLTGSLSLAERPGAARHLAAEAKARVAVGIRAELWTPAQVAEKTSGRLNTSTVMAALWMPDEGRIQPLTLLAHLARQARAAGVSLVGGARMSALSETTGAAQHSGWDLQLEDGATIAARGLILATGPTAEPNARIYALAFPAELPDDFPLFWDSAPFTYADYRPGDGRLGVSGGRYGRAGAIARDAHYHRRLTESTRHWLPELAQVAPSHAWAVDLAVAPDMVPQTRVLGERAPGLAIEGLGALGVLPGILLGRRAGTQVATRVS
ncbi:MAG: hypothetical protein OJF49_004523 [Ktedonobacterales bacterium]|jgi:glycine/D-amino acid oxidase-like deaminating enzyme|nr:MAG: hypothetical protein OJF49_004523 [Ktedonobacterales bacterium]